jgi:hypothetical protein
MKIGTDFWKKCSVSSKKMKEWIQLTRPNSAGSPPLSVCVAHIRVVHEYEVDPKHTRVEFDHEHHLLVQESVSEVMSLIEASRYDSDEE